MRIDVHTTILQGRVQLFVVFFFLSLSAFGQMTVTGTVISSDDKQPLPGINIVVKGTTNGTATDLNGKYVITVNDPADTLIFTFIGYLWKEEPVKGRSLVNVTMKLDCVRDWFDLQRIGLNLVSGVVNTPLGGQLEIAFPPFFLRKGTFTSSLTYQTNLDDNTYLNADVKLLHFIFTCNFDMDAGWFYRKIAFGNDFDAVGNSFETNFNFHRLRFITGYSHLNYTPGESGTSTNFDGALLGMSTWVGGKLRLEIFGKVAIYKDKQEIFGEIRRESRHLDVYVKYYKLDTFTELSFGVGTTFGYRLKKQR